MTGVPGHLVDADAVAIALAWLRNHAGITAEFGGPEHVSGMLEAPWPHIVVTPGPGGDLGDLRWVTRQEVSLEVYGDPYGRPGQAGLWRLAVRAAVALAELRDAAFPAGQPVVSDVDRNGAAAWSPLPSGQGRWIISAFLTVHPPAAV